MLLKKCCIVLYEMLHSFGYPLLNTICFNEMRNAYGQVRSFHICSNFSSLCEAYIGGIGRERRLKKLNHIIS